MKDLLRANQVKNNQKLNQAIYSINELRYTLIRNEISGNEYPNKMISVVEKILNFNKQQKCKGLKIPTPKQMFQRLSIALHK